MKIIKAPLDKFKKIIKTFSLCKRKLRECEIKNRFLNEQIKMYNLKNTKD